MQLKAGARRSKCRKFVRIAPSIESLCTLLASSWGRETKCRLRPTSYGATPESRVFTWQN